MTPILPSLHPEQASFADAGKNHGKHSHGFLGVPAVFFIFAESMPSSAILYIGRDFLEILRKAVFPCGILSEGYLQKTAGYSMMKKRRRFYDQFFQ